MAIGGHRATTATSQAKVLDEQAEYLRELSEAVKGSKSAQELSKRIAARHPKLELPVILEVAAQAAFPPRS